MEGRKSTDGEQKQKKHRFFSNTSWTKRAGASQSAFVTKEVNPKNFQEDTQPAQMFTLSPNGLSYH